MTLHKTFTNPKGFSESQGTLVLHLKFARTAGAIQVAALNTSNHVPYTLFVRARTFRSLPRSSTLCAQCSREIKNKREPCSKEGEQLHGYAIGGVSVWLAHLLCFFVFPLRGTDSRVFHPGKHQSSPLFCTGSTLFVTCIGSN